MRYTAFLSLDYEMNPVYSATRGEIISNSPIETHDNEQQKLKFLAG